jgi:hypothetical protein
MLPGVLRSSKAIKINISIMRPFVTLNLIDSFLYYSIYMSDPSGVEGILHDALYPISR